MKQPRLRELFGNVLYKDQSFQDFELEHDFPHIGTRTFRLMRAASHCRMRMNGGFCLPWKMSRRGAKKRSFAITGCLKRLRTASSLSTSRPKDH